MIRKVVSAVCRDAGQVEFAAVYSAIYIYREREREKVKKKKKKETQGADRSFFWCLFYAAFFSLSLSLFSKKNSGLKKVENRQEEIASTQLRR